MLRLSAHGAPGGREGEGSVAAKDKRNAAFPTPPQTGITVGAASDPKKDPLASTLRPLPPDFGQVSGSAL